MRIQGPLSKISYRERFIALRFPAGSYLPFGYCWRATTLKKFKETIIILYALLFIPVQRDTAQVQDWRCGEQDIEGRSDQAEHLSIDPVVLNQLDGSKRHHQHRHQQVRKGKGNNEIIGLDFPARQITELGWNSFGAASSTYGQRFQLVIGSNLLHHTERSSLTYSSLHRVTSSSILVSVATYPLCSLHERIFLLPQTRQMDAHRPLRVAQPHSLRWRVWGGGGGFCFNL